VGRVCLNVLRARTARPEEPVGVHIPDPILAREDVPSPEQEALLADSVGLALMVVLDTLTPAERLAFVMALMFNKSAADLHPVLINGTAGVLITAAGRPVTIMSFTITEGRITRIDGITDPVRVGSLALEVTSG
jgi:hypothetical protein